MHWEPKAGQDLKPQWRWATRKLSAHRTQIPFCEWVWHQCSGWVTSLGASGEVDTFFFSYRKQWVWSIPSPLRQGQTHPSQAWKAMNLLSTSKLLAGSSKEMSKFGLWCAGVGVPSSSPLLEINVVVPQKARHRTTIWSSQNTSWEYSQQTLYSTVDLFTHSCLLLLCSQLPGNEKA